MEELEMPNPRRRRRRTPKWPFILGGGLLLLTIVILVAVLSGGGEKSEPEATTRMVTTTQPVNVYTVELTLKGEAEMVLQFPEEYREPGAEAMVYGSVINTDPQPLEVTVQGRVDATKLGSYTITYSASFEDVDAEQTRTVTVVDTQKPEITLVSDPEHYTLPGGEYKEEGYTATDNYDGDLTSQVQTRVEDGKVIYSVTDSSGNTTEITRQIVYKDPIAPEITLKGKASQTITAGDSWKEPGYTATDNVDGDLTEQVKVTGKVDSKKAGTYTLTYQVTDEAGNTTSVTRTIKVNNPPKPENQDSQKPTTQPENQGSNGAGKVIYLTFDDGPGKHTPRLLEVLAKYNVKATFFVCNTPYLRYLSDVAQAGHSVAIHSKTHNYNAIYASEDAFYQDIYAMQDLIYQHTGIKSTLLRFPGGTSNGISKKICPGIMTKLSQSVIEKGFQYFDWNVDSNDAGGAKDAQTVANNVINGIKNSKRTHFFVLQHDIFGYSVDAVETIIKWGLENGYTFLPLDMDSPVCHHKPNN